MAQQNVDKSNSRRTYVPHPHNVCLGEKRERVLLPPHLPWLGEHILDVDLVTCNGFTVPVKDDEARRCCSLIDTANKPALFLFLTCLLNPNREETILLARHVLRCCPMGFRNLLLGVSGIFSSSFTALLTAGECLLPGRVNFHLPIGLEGDTERLTLLGWRESGPINSGDGLGAGYREQ